MKDRRRGADETGTRAGDRADTPQVPAAPPPKKSKAKLLIMASLVLVIGLGAAGFFAWRYFSPSPEAGSAATSTPAPAEAATSHAANEHGAPGGALGDSAIINFEPFLVNLADEDAIRYLRVTIRLQVINKVAAEKIAATEVLPSQMRDAILATLSTKIATEIVKTEGKEALKAEIMETLNMFLPEKPVTAVFFTDFVVQL